MIERFVSINPENRSEYLKIVENKFREWHGDEWSLVYPSYEFFHDKIANASFLAYLEYFLEAAVDTGKVDTSLFEDMLRKRLGEYFSSEKFENAVTFLKSDDWHSL